MPEEPSFPALLRRVRAGDARAVVEPELPDSPEALRKRLARAPDRVARQPGLEKVPHE
jgi:hypothetical protein